MTLTYTADVRWEDGQWQATVDGLPGAHTFARTTTALRKRLREVIVLMDGRPDSDLSDESSFEIGLNVRVTASDNMGLTDHYSGGDIAAVHVSASGRSTSSGFAEATILGARPDQALQMAADARARAARAEEEAEHVTAIAILLARNAGISMRDAATLLGISHQRVQQIAAAGTAHSMGVPARDSAAKEITVTQGNDSDRYVQKRDDGQWEVVKEDAGRASAVTRTQREAIDRAREIVHKAGGGELTIKGEDGKIRAKDTIAPGNDPRSSKG